MNVHISGIFYSPRARLHGNSDSENLFLLLTSQKMMINPISNERFWSLSTRNRKETLLIFTIPLANTNGWAIALGLFTVWRRQSNVRQASRRICLWACFHACCGLFYEWHRSLCSVWCIDKSTDRLEHKIHIRLPGWVMRWIRCGLFDKHECEINWT